MAICSIQFTLGLPISHACKIFSEYTLGDHFWRRLWNHRLWSVSKSISCLEEQFVWHCLLKQSSSGSSGRVRGAEKHEIYAAAFGGHLFYDLFSQGRGGPWPPRPPPWIRYWAQCFLNTFQCHTLLDFDANLLSCTKQILILPYHF